jgi:hypothetical protein
MDGITIAAGPMNNTEKHNFPDYSKVHQYLDKIKCFWEDRGVQECFRCQGILEPHLVYAER